MHDYSHFFVEGGGRVCDCQHFETGRISCMYSKREDNFAVPPVQSKISQCIVILTLHAWVATANSYLGILIKGTGGNTDSSRFS